MADAAPLARLGFLQAYASSALVLAESSYKTARSFVPGFVEPYVQQLEETAVALGAPYLTAAQDTAEKVVRSVDAQVDGLLAYSADLHTKNLSTFTSAKDQYFGLVETSLASAKALLDPAPYVSWAGDKVAQYADPDKIVDTSLDVAGKVAAFGPVPKVLEIYDPLINAGVKTYGSVHDTVVSLPLYKKLWSLLFATSSTLQESWAVKKFLEVGYPVVAPVADPLVANVTNSKYIKQLQSHLEPAKDA